MIDDLSMHKALSIFLVTAFAISIFFYYSKSMKTIEYYNNNAQGFYERTIGADLSEDYNKFLSLLPLKARILDAGCGVGRDVKYFHNKGYNITAFDPSSEMVKLATSESRVKVLQMSFQEMSFENEFDGIWASLSLIHVPYNETREVYTKIHRALKPGGVFYASYKYGKDLMTMLGRDFYNMNEDTIVPYLDGLFEIVEIWKVEDTRSKVSPAPDKMLLQFIMKKKVL